VALIVKENTFEPYTLKQKSETIYDMVREDALKEILAHMTSEDIIVSTTGKCSREVFEYRAMNNQGHQNDFLTVGGMGHANQIALGIALNTNKKVYSIDGDGAALMHMGSLAIIGNSSASNLIHIVINNGAHDSVGGQPTVAHYINLTDIAKACGYKYTKSILVVDEIRNIFAEIVGVDGPIFIEIKTNKGSRKNLGRPTTSPLENKLELMKIINS